MTKHYEQAYDEAFARGFKKAEAEFSSKGSPAYLNWLHFEHLKRKEQQDLYDQADKMAKLRKGVVNKFHGKFGAGNGILGYSTNFRDDIMSGFKQKHPKANIYTGGSWQYGGDNVNSQTVGINDNTEEDKFIKELLKKKLKEYHDKNFVSKMFSKKPNEEAMLAYSPEERAELEKRVKEHGSAHFYTVANPDADKTELKKLFNTMSITPRDKSHIY